MRKKKILVSLIVLLLPLIGVLESEATINESGTISQDTVWTADDVHLVTGNISVPAGIRLTIDPGTIVKFNSGRSLSVDSGALVAIGDADNKIVFTSYRDDAYGGDTNGDGYSTGEAGDWDRISINNSVTGVGEGLEHAIIRYGGSGNQGSIYISQSDMTVISSKV